MVSKKRVSIPVNTIREIQQACYQHDDDMRWLMTIMSDTGMRLAEAAGLHINDLHLDEEIPYVDIKPHQWRSLKTKGSQRQIPLVGASLWGCNALKRMPHLAMHFHATRTMTVVMLTQHPMA